MLWLFFMHMMIMTMMMLLISNDDDDNYHHHCDHQNLSDVLTEGQFNKTFTSVI